jgi:alkanesulfonate monooxygenase SsuD/methylene tetrahydromethanopterin reductase-like flavin-dependent oxidoreductase (luciferase family)
MDFSLFIQMERIDEEQSQKRLYDEFVDLCQIADKSGFKTIWTGEHHGMNFTIAPNPFVNIADLANKTNNVRLGTGTIIAPFWHPIKLAEEAAMTDIISDGRLEIGIARGAYSFEYDRLAGGMDAFSAGSALREIVPAIKALWKGDYTGDGEHWSFPKTTSSPKPLQSPNPPIWIAARDPNSHEFAIKNNCNVQVTPLWQSYKEVSDLITRFKDAQIKCQNNAQSKIMLLQHTFVAGSDTEMDYAANKFSEFYGHFGAWFKNERSVDQAVMKKLSHSEVESLEMYSPEVMKANLAIGNSTDVIKLLKKYEELGYDEFAYWVDSGMSFELKKSFSR